MDTVFIVDNSPAADSQLIENLSSQHRVLHSGQNLGLGAAYNLACQHAIDLGYEWIILLDQDTELHGDYRARMSSIFAEWSTMNETEIGIAAPNFRNSQSPPSDAGPQTTVAHSVDAAVSSGSLVNLSAWSHLGGFREDFFIDYVDTEFCRRLIAGGYSVAMSADVLMSHGMGHPALNQVLGYRRYTSNYPAWRHYFIARNFVLTVKASLQGGDWIWAARETRRRIKFSLLTAVMEPDRREKLAATARGCADGIRGRVTCNPVPHN
ncbi:glycosyl transferase [Terrabacter tumescens]|uniref:Glycosyl transferase n=1 Tax=Terrabacter tumescens TaxID=60443 RepID=A0ABQ2I213_9MICO|nr:glycosyl transferase [Terrabacter tumescens]